MLFSYFPHRIYSHCILSIGILAVIQHNSQKNISFIYFVVFCYASRWWYLLVLLLMLCFFFLLLFVSHTTFCFMLKFHGAIVRMASTHTSHHSKFITKALFIVYTVVYVVVVVAVVVFTTHSQTIDSTEMHFSIFTFKCVLDCAQRLPQQDKPLSMYAWTCVGVWNMFVDVIHLFEISTDVPLLSHCTYCAILYC